MNIIPALEMKGWRPSETNCTDNQIVVKYDFHAKADFFCRLCSCKMHRRGTRQIRITDTPYMQYDVKLLIDTPRADALEIRHGCKIRIEFCINELSQYIYFLYLMIDVW